MAAPSNPDRLGSSAFWKTYASSGALGANVSLTTDGNGIPRFFRVGVAGDVVLKRSFDATNETIYNVQAGEMVPVQATDLIATGTTAQQITFFW